jgi:hypothetical protein
MAASQQRHSSSYDAQSSHAYATFDNEHGRAFSDPNVSYKRYNRPLDTIHRLRLRHSRPEYFVDITGPVRHFLPCCAIFVTILTCTQCLPPRNELAHQRSHPRPSAIPLLAADHDASERSNQQPSHPTHHPGKQ